VKISPELREWARRFRPDFIFAQGYNLAFTTLPLQLAKCCGTPIVYYATDDWPAALYNCGFSTGAARLLSRLTRRSVVKESRRLIRQATVRIAFNKYMQEEYCQRYGREFSVLMHGDQLSRFAKETARRSAAEGTCSIVCAGDFDHYRLPLLADLDRACAVLNSEGVKITATVYFTGSAATMPDGLRYVRFLPSPSHDDLVSVLKGADILFLPERFDETAKLIRLSVSSKAHLYMFAGRPSLVYSDAVTGLARYATEEGWALVVDQRDPESLASALRRLIFDKEERARVVDRAQRVAARNHDRSAIQEAFQELLVTATQR